MVCLLVRRVLGEDVPVRAVGEGGEHSTWWVGERYVARFALDPAGSARQRREIALRDLIRPYVGIPLPHSVATGEWEPGRTFTIDGRLPGVSAEERGVGAAGEGDLARLLAELRSVPVGAAAALGTPEAKPRVLDDLVARAAEAARWLSTRGEFDIGLLSRLRSGQGGGTAPVVVHDDLKGEHLLVAGDGRVCGVLDWTDAVIGDQAEDLAGLAIAVGAARVVRLAGSAGRALTLARCDTVLLLGDRLRGLDDSPLPLLRVQLRRAWETV